MRNKNIIFKFIIWIFLVVAVLLLVIFLIQKRTKQFDPSRIALVDVVGNNYIFRGNEPFTGKNGELVFEYEKLKSSFNQILKNEGYVELDYYYLIDISLLDIDNYYAIAAEKDFFAKNPNCGFLMNFSVMSPTLGFERIVGLEFTPDFLINSYNAYLTETTEKIRSKITKNSNKPVVVYVHCDAGRDRTGLIISAYRILHKNMSLQDTKIANIRETRRDVRDPYNKAIYAYCLQIQKQEKKESNYCEIK